MASSPPAHSSPLDPQPPNSPMEGWARFRRAPYRATIAFALSFAALSLGLAALRIHKLQRYDARWPAELHWALELVTWPFIALAAAVLFAFAATLRRTRTDPWPRALGFGVTLAALIAAPSILGAQTNSPLASWFTWLLALVGPLLAGARLQESVLPKRERKDQKTSESAP